MSGKHSTKSKEPLVPQAPEAMPDPDNLQIDVDNLPLTGPVLLPRRD
jgi:hypothetical protein